MTGTGTTATAEPSIFDRVEIPDELVRAARDKRWPDGLLERALRLRVSRGDVQYWLDNGVAERFAKYLGDRERVMFGTLRVREATWMDDEAVADLYAHSPEEIGEWEVTVERSPYPFAQFRLQENANVQIVEDRGIVLGAAAHSGRNTIVDGKRVTCHIASAWRVRSEFRGQGVTNLMRTLGGPCMSWFGLINYWYMRAGNFSAVDWLKALRPDLAEAAVEREGTLPGAPVTVHHFRTRPFDGDATGIRKVPRSDTRRCVALINRTHRGLDFFRPYSEDFLRLRLDDRGWGPKPHFITAVYGWDDYYILEEAGRVIACAGLWDRGRDVREVWRHKTSGETIVVAPTALMDFGFAAGREDAMERLLGYLIGVSHGLGRHELLAPIEQLPALLERVAGLEPAAETRHMGVDGFHEAGLDIDVTVHRPYTDLAYW